MIENPPIRIYINEIENRITFRVNTGYYLDLLTPETMKLLGSNESKTFYDENGENIPCLEITAVVLAYFNVVKKDFPQDSRVLYTFASNILKIEVWFSDQSSNSLEIEDKISITLVTNKSVKYKKFCAIQFSLEIKYL